MEILDLKPDDLLDIWFEPTTKDQSGWRGPAAVKSVQAAEGNASVRIQGRTLDRQRNEIRAHVPYFIMAFLLRPASANQWYIIVAFVETLRIGQSKVFGLMWVETSGWRMISHCSTVEGRDVFRAAMIAAASIVHLDGCIGIRVWRGLVTLAPMAGISDSEILMWLPSDSDEHPMHFTTEPGDLQKQIPCKELAQHFSVEATKQFSWQEVCFVQFYCLGGEQLERV